MKIRDLPITSIIGVIIITVFITFTTISVILYPLPWSPKTTFLSDFGNMKTNVYGSKYFNIGLIIAGITIIPFYIGLNDWYPEDKLKYLIVIGQLLGIGSGIALALIGIYPEDFPKDHRFWSYTFFQINFFAMFFINTALLTNKNYSRRVAIIAYAFLVVTLGLYLINGGAPIVEWLTVSESLIFAGLLSLETWWLKDTE